MRILEAEFRSIQGFTFAKGGSISKNRPAQEALNISCSWVVISSSNLSCGYLMLPGLAGAQEGAESTREGIVEGERHNRT